MRYQWVLFRIIFGLTFVLSGIVKLIDPTGTSLIVQEYFNALHLGSLSFLCTPFGILLSLVEFITGVAILMRMRMKEAAVSGLVLTVFFTIVSIFLLVFDPIKDCGCFGQAVTLTHWETFIKNVVLLVCIIPIFIQRGKFRRDSSVLVEWLFLSIYALLAFVLSMGSLVRMPIVEFGDFRTGADLAIKLSESAENDQFETVCIYERDGERGEFTLDNLPDTTWSYIETVDKSKVQEGTPFDFYVVDGAGNHITDSLIFTDAPVVICSVYDVAKFYNSKRWSELNIVRQSVEERGGVFWILASSTPDEIKSIFGESVEELFRIGYTDYKTAIAVNRSNGGYLYLHNAFVVKKWSRQGLDPEDELQVMEQDSDIVMIRGIIKQQLITYVSIVVLLVSILVIRYLCKVVAMRRLRSIRESENQEEL